MDLVPGSSPPRTEHKAAGKAMAPHTPSKKVQIGLHTHMHTPPHTHTIIHNVYTSSSVGQYFIKYFK